MIPFYLWFLSTCYSFLIMTPFYLWFISISFLSIFLMFLPFLFTYPSFLLMTSLYFWFLFYLFSFDSFDFILHVIPLIPFTIIYDSSSIAFKQFVAMMCAFLKNSWLGRRCNLRQNFIFCIAWLIGESVSLLWLCSCLWLSDPYSSMVREL